ncbi:hypothetical protein RCF73_03000 [Staphylococcus chromogenes]|uniref:hypothetical protein n=1 Tax=Staphylococcus chromogenes TaxID=46126 RepID=UPI003B009320
MAKIKVKKEMTLPEIIQWGWDNRIKNEDFIANLGGRIHFDKDSYIDIQEDTLIAPEETFEVEVKEEITEDTKITRLTEMYEYEGNPNTHLYKNITIKELLNFSQSDPLYVPKAFYMLNDDMTMTLIWRNGGMVK